MIDRLRADLASDQRKLKKKALNAALCIIAIGMRSTGKFSTEELQRIFLNAEE